MNFQACVPLVCELHLYYEESLFLKPHWSNKTHD
jgi:hypothetical protein